MYVNPLEKLTYYNDVSNKVYVYLWTSLHIGRGDIILFITKLEFVQRRVWSAEKAVGYRKELIDFYYHHYKGLQTYEYESQTGFFSLCRQFIEQYNTVQRREFCARQDQLNYNQCSYCHKEGHRRMGCPDKNALVARGEIHEFEGRTHEMSWVSIWLNLLWLTSQLF